MFWASFEIFTFSEVLLSRFTECEIYSRLLEGTVSFLNVPSLCDIDEGSCDKSSTKSKNSSVFIWESVLSYEDGSINEGLIFLLDKWVDLVGSEPTDSSMGTRNLGSSDIFESFNWSVEMAVGDARFWTNNILPML